MSTSWRSQITARTSAVRNTRTRHRSQAIHDLGATRRCLQQEEVTAWLRDAIKRGTFGELWEGSFPRYVWYKAGETVYEARLLNCESGEYKGYPLEADEWPPSIATFYE